MNVPFLTWIGRCWSRPQPTLTAIYACQGAGEPPCALSVATVEQGRGLVGDRYHQGRGYWRAVEACQLTLITAHDLARVRRRGAVRLEQGEHRRNLVVSGISSRQLQGQRFRIGQAMFAYHKPRPPCGYIDKVSEPGMCRALGRHGGICLQVLQGGEIRAGDPLILESNGSPLSR